MNDNAELIERLWIAECFLSGICAGRESPSSIESKEAVRDAIAALKAAPRWCERPTGPGVWCGVTGSHAYLGTLDQEDIDFRNAGPRRWTCERYYGPIPNDPGAK